MVLLGDLLNGAACERAERLLHDEYAGEDVLLLHLLDVVPDRLHPGLGLIGEEHVDLQVKRTARVTPRQRRRRRRRMGEQRNRGRTCSEEPSNFMALLARSSRRTGLPKRSMNLSLGRLISSSLTAYPRSRSISCTVRRMR